MKLLLLLLCMSVISSTAVARPMYATPNIESYADFKRAYSFFNSVYPTYVQDPNAIMQEAACQVEQIQAELFARHPHYAFEFNQDTASLGSFAENAQQWQNRYQTRRAYCQQLRQDDAEYRRNSKYSLVN